jgi:quercetin dioxygenase-like cupin family protein
MVWQPAQAFGHEMKTEPLITSEQSSYTRSGRISLEPGEDVGEHIPYQREELIIIIKGIATVIVQNRFFELNPGEAKFIPEGIRHNVVNNTDKEIEYIYVVNLLKK